MTEKLKAFLDSHDTPNDVKENAFMLCKKMKNVIYFLLFLMIGCSEQETSLELVAVQHIGKGIINGDACKTLYREDGRTIISPEKFRITPFQAIKIAKDELGYSCTNKLGADILSDGKSYFIVRLGVKEDAIIINGTDGTIKSKGFMRRAK